MERIEKVMLINPSTSVERESIKRLVTPLGLLYVGEVLRQGGYEVSVLDSTCEGYYNVVRHDDYDTYGLSNESIRQRIEKESPGAVGIACSFSYQDQRVYDLCGLVKSVDKDILTMVGGIHPSLLPEKMLKECEGLDFIIMKEGEYRALELLDSINNRRDYRNQDGIAFRENEGVKINPVKSFVKNLDNIPHPARDLININDYIKINKQANPFSKSERAERIFTSRGCPFDCCFCAGSSFWGGIRLRSIDNVVEELKILKDDYDIREIQFSDDNMTVNKKRMMGLLKRMKEEFDFNWCTHSGVLISTLDDDMLKAMSESGCYQLSVSPESGSQRVVNDIIHKPIDLKKVKPVIDNAHKYGISMHSNFVVGLPGETKEEMMRTFDFAKEVGFDSAAFFIAVPYPGTELYNICKSRGWLKENASTADFKHSNIVIGKHEKEYVMPGEELVKLTDEKTREFNEWSRKRNPEAWNRKYKSFLCSHAELSDKIDGRVV